MTDPASLSPEQQARLEKAAEGYRSLMHGARWATITFWTVGIFGALSVAWGLVAGLSGVIVGAALLAVAWNEKRGRDRLRALDPEGARILGWNQIVLAVVVTAYLLFAIARAWGSPSPSVQELEELAGVGPETVSLLTTFVYGVVIVVVVAVQVIMARYHYRRVPRLEAFRRDTPDWVVGVLTGLGG